jgi:hypothetical protein
VPKATAERRRVLKSMMGIERSVFALKVGCVDGEREKSGLTLVFI